MAISSTAVWEIRTTGSDSNGGGFDPAGGGIDRSQSDTPFASGTNLTVDGTTNTDVAPDGHTPGTNDVGNIIQITAGAGFTLGFYEIVSIQAGKWRLDRSPAAVSTAGATWALGGSLLTFDKADDGIVAGNVCYIKSGTYNRSTGWALTLQGSSANGGFIRFVGYSTNRNPNNLDTKPIVVQTANSQPTLQGNNATRILFHNIEWRNTATTRARFAESTSVASSGIYFWYCVFDGFTSVNNNTTNSNFILDPILTFCECKNFTSYVFDKGRSDPVSMFGCYLHDCVGAVLQNQSSSNIVIEFCIVANMSAYGVNLTRTTTSVTTPIIRNSIFYNCALGGMRVAANAGVYFGSVYELWQCIFVGGAYGLTASNNNFNDAIEYRNNAFFNQTTAARNNWAEGINEIILTADPFIDAANGDFRLNNTAGGGALLRNAGLPAAVGLTANYSDIGPTRHQDPAGGGATEHAYAFLS